MLEATHPTHSPTPTHHQTPSPQATSTPTHPKLQVHQPPRLWVSPCRPTIRPSQPLACLLGYIPRNLITQNPYGFSVSWCITLYPVFPICCKKALYFSKFKKGKPSTTFLFSHLMLERATNIQNGLSSHTGHRVLYHRPFSQHDVLVTLPSPPS